MDNKNQKNMSNLEFKSGKSPNEYKVLAQKLKVIKEIIDTLEKNFLERDR